MPTNKLIPGTNALSFLALLETHHLVEIHSSWQSEKPSRNYPGGVDGRREWGTIFLVVDSIDVDCKKNRAWKNLFPHLDRFLPYMDGRV